MEIEGISNSPSEVGLSTVDIQGLYRLCILINSLWSWVGTGIHSSTRSVLFGFIHLAPSLACLYSHLGRLNFLLLLCLKIYQCPLRKVSLFSWTMYGKISWQLGWCVYNLKSAVYWKTGLTIVTYALISVVHVHTSHEIVKSSVHTSKHESFTFIFHHLNSELVHSSVQVIVLGWKVRMKDLFFIENFIHHYPLP